MCDVLNVCMSAHVPLPAPAPAACPLPAPPPGSRCGWPTPAPQFGRRTLPAPAQYWGVHNGKSVVTNVRYQCTCTKNEKEKECASMRTTVHEGTRESPGMCYLSVAVEPALLPSEHDNPPY